jgi:hypothetical protein
MAVTTLLGAYHRPQFSLYEHRISDIGFLFGLLALED